MDWWDRASGPGPFLGLFFDYRFACVNNTTSQADFGKLTNPLTNQAIPEPVAEGRRTVTWLKPRDRTAIPSLWIRPVEEAPRLSTYINTQTPDVAEGVRRYRAAAARVRCTNDTDVPHFFTVTFRWDHSYNNDLVPSKDDPLCRANDCDPLRTVRATGFGIGYFKRIGGGVAVGAVPGFTRFSGPAFTPVFRWSFTPTIEYAPFATRDEATDEHGHWLTVIAGWTIMDGLHRSDFCNRPQYACNVLDSVPNPWPGTNIEHMFHLGLVYNRSLR